MKRKDLLKLLNTKSIRINETNPLFEEISDDQLITYGAKLKQKSLVKSFDPLKPYYGFVAGTGVRLTTEELTKSKFSIALMNYYTLSGQPSKIEEAMLYYVRVPYLHNNGGASSHPEDFTDPNTFDTALKASIPCIVSPLELSSYAIIENGRMVKIRFIDQNMDSALIIGFMNSPVVLAKTLQPYLSDLIGVGRAQSYGVNVGGYNRNIPIGNILCENGKIFNQGQSESSNAKTKMREVPLIKKTEDSAVWQSTITLLGSYIKLGESSGGKAPSERDYGQTNPGGYNPNLTQTPIGSIGRSGAKGAYQHLGSYLDSRLRFIQSSCADENYTSDSLFDKKLQDDMFADLVLNRVPGIGGYVRGADVDLGQALIELGATFMAVGMPFNGKYEERPNKIINLYKNDCYYPEEYSTRRNSRKSNNRATLDPETAANILRTLRATYAQAKSISLPPERYTQSTVENCF